MILEFNQIDRQPNTLFEGKIKGQIVVTGKGTTHFNDGFIDYNGSRYEISSKLHREKLADKTATQVSDILKDGKRVGFIYPDLVAMKKVLFLSFGYDYFNFIFNGNKYTVYEVGLGQNQHYICVYSGNETVAIIHKEDKKHNYCDKYVVYALNETLLLDLSILTLYFDCIRYPNHGEFTGESYVDDSFLTTQKELNEKYDPSFIPCVKRMDGIMD